MDFIFGVGAEFSMATSVVFNLQTVVKATENLANFVCDLNLLASSYTIGWILV